MNVNPILLQDMGKATFNNATAVQQLHLSHTLMPILELLEDEIERVLLPKEDRDTVCAEFDTRGFVRADVEKAAAALRTEVELGVATINEARADRGRSPVAGGDAPRTTIQTQPIGASSTPPKGR
jgi:HK97 family phage portal protein